MTLNDEASDSFSRLHRIFVFHFGIAVALAWATALYAAASAPWVRNIRPLIDPSNVGRVESTWSFVFGLPFLLAVAWIIVYAGRDVLRDMMIMRNQAAEFAAAGAVAFIVFYLSIDRAVAAILLAAQ